MFKCILILCFVSHASAFALKASFGECPEVEPMPNFDIYRLLGTWYFQYEYYWPLPFSISCGTFDFIQDNNGTFKYIYSASSFLLNPKFEVTLNTDEPNNPGQLTATWGLISYPFWILDTDYTTYAVSWSCSSIAIAHLQGPVIFTRDRDASDDVLSTGRMILERNDIDVTSLRRENQSNCDN